MTSADMSAPDASSAPAPPSWRGLPRALLLGAAAVAALLALTTPLRVVAVPALLALFPAAVLVPAQRRLRAQGVPAALAAALLTAAAVSVVVSAAALAVPMMVAELPRLVDSLAVALRQVMAALEASPLGVGIAGLDPLLERGGTLLRSNGDPLAQATAALEVAGEVIAGTIILVVTLFFYLKDGGRIAAGLRQAVPASWRPHAVAVGTRSWLTLGAFFRGQLLVAFVDALFIGVGLLLIGVPLALPLALLVFLGGLLPIVGAVASGAIAVLVALADGGLGPAVAVLVLVVAVQQLESNLLQPVVMSRMTAVHPLLVILSISLGWLALGVVGAFLAVPLTACLARSFDYWREVSPAWRQATDRPSGSSRHMPPPAEASST
jgi:putative heme transporter